MPIIREANRDQHNNNKKIGFLLGHSDTSLPMPDCAMVSFIGCFSNPNPCIYDRRHEFCGSQSKTDQ